MQEALYISDGTVFCAFTLSPILPGSYAYMYVHSFKCLLRQKKLKLSNNYNVKGVEMDMPVENKN